MASATRVRPSAHGRTSARPPAPSQAPAAPRLKARPGHFGSFRLQQLVLIEIAAALLLVAWVIDPLMLVPAVVVAAVLVLLALLRRHRRSLPEWLATVFAL